MVRLHTSLLVVTLAAGSALASSNEYQRRSDLDANNLQSRGFLDEKDLSVRDLDAFDDLEARGGKLRTLIHTAKFIAHHKHTKHALKVFDYGSQMHDTYQSRGLEDNDEHLFERDINAEDSELFMRDFFYDDLD